MQFRTLLQDRPALENKYHTVGEPFDPFKRMNYHGWGYDMATGLDDAEMLRGVAALIGEMGDQPHALQKARAFAYVLDHSPIMAPEADYFVGFYSWSRLANPSTVAQWNSEATASLSEESRNFIADHSAAGSIAMWVDYDHSVPDWDALYTLGFPGVLERAQAARAEHARRAPLTPAQEAYFDAIDIEYSAILRLLDRMADAASRADHPKASLQETCLRHLRQGPPQNTYEVLQLIYLYFILSESVDSYQVRSLGSGLDHDLYPYYCRDVESGTFTHDEIAEFLGYFLMQFSAIGNYWGQPFYLGGTHPDGSTKVNPLSHLILEVYAALGIYNPKIQIKFSRRTPEDFLRRALNMIRSGCSSIVFICEDGMVRALMAAGETYEEALTADVKGCYEYAARGGMEVSTAPSYVNLLSGVPLVLSRGRHGGKAIGPDTGDLASLADYDSFYAAYLTQMDYIFRHSIAAANEMERHLEEINPSPMYSATMPSSLAAMEDGYATGARYNNTAIVVSAMASAVDALMAVKYLVYDTCQVTLPQLARILDANWEGHEALRAAALACPHKYGVNDPEANACTRALADWFSAFQGTPNVRRGIYKITVHSARMFIQLGQLTGATPDGRLAGDETSKNASPTMGMDTQGVTALILSALESTPCQFMEAHCLDVMLHPTAVQGEEGLIAMRGLLDVYDRGGGSAIQFNVLDASTLLDAQKHPEKYRNLQVRVCGWNVLFNNMCKEEQDAYIRRAFAVGGGA